MGQGDSHAHLDADALRSRAGSSTVSFSLVVLGATAAVQALVYVLGGSVALVADGQHARIDGLVSLGVVASPIAVGLGAVIADPVIGLAIAVLILRIAWQAWATVR